VLHAHPEPTNELLRASFDLSADGIVVTDRYGVVRNMNSAAEAIFASPGETLIGRTFAWTVLPGETQELAVGVPGRDPRVVQIRAAVAYVGGESVRIVNARDITELARLRDELRALSLIDELTCLHNRRGFMRLAQQQLQLAHRSGRQLLIVFVDLDGMKRINDTLGHSAGDAALTEVAGVLRETFRCTDVLARVGGDEFAAVSIEAPGATAAVIENRLRTNVDNRNADPGRRFRLSLSVGATSYDPADPRTLEDLMAHADARMYEDKRRKRVSDFIPRRAE